MPKRCTGGSSYLDDMTGLVNRSLSVEGESSIDLGGHLAGDNLQDLPAELDQESVQGGIDLFINCLALFDQHS